MDVDRLRAELDEARRELARAAEPVAVIGTSSDPDHALVEQAREALDHAGVAHGAAVGVYLGSGAGVVARALSLGGPAVTVHGPPDAMGMAVRALRAGDCDLALTSADGGIVVLERLSDARRAGRAVLDTHPSTQDFPGDWRYRVEWQPVPDPGDGALTGTWLVVLPGDDRLDAAPLVAALARAGADVLVVRTRFAEVIAAHPGLAGVVSLAGLDERPHPDHPAVPVGLATTLALLHALVDADRTVPLHLLTRGAVGVAGAPPTAPRQNAVWGMGRVIALEHPDRWGGLVDLPDRLTDDALRRVVALIADPAEDQAAVRASGVHARRLVRAPLPGPAAPPWRPGRPVLVTGASGALGPHIARWLAGLGARHLVLTGKRGDTAPGMADLRADLAAAGVATTVTACDLADRAAVAAMLARLRADGVRVGSVVHAAAHIDPAPLTATDLPRLAAALGAKAAGADHLTDVLDGDPDLEAVVFFTSVAGTWGSAEHGAYAAANAYLDARAEAGRAAGLPTTAVAWGVWDARDPHRAATRYPEVLRRQGLPRMRPGPALAALTAVLAHREHAVAVAAVDWARFAPVFASAAPRPLLDGVPEARATHPVSAGTTLLDLVTATVSAVAGHAPGLLGPERPFAEIGVDSPMAVEIRDRLAAATGTALPVSVVHDHPTPARLAAFLRAQGKPEPQPDRPADAVAIVGVACRYPGGVRTPEDLWRLVADGADAVAGFPTDRNWDLDSLAGPTGGAFLDAVADFDAAFFGVDPAEALAMDPQQRLLLELSWEAVERAGTDPRSLRGTRTAVFAGALQADYGTRAAHDLAALDLPPGVAELLPQGNDPAAATGRVAHALGLAGPALTLASGSSSGLHAVHLAARALLAGECDAALAGGVAVIPTPVTFSGLGAGLGLSPDGRCRSFSATADGAGLAEGAGVLLLRRLSDALADGDPVVAVVRGSAVNHAGGDAGAARRRVMADALADAGLTGADVDLVEGHGAGTPRDDALEVEAVAATYGDRPPGGPVLLRSARSQLACTQNASGIAGIIVSALAMRHGVVPASASAETPTTRVAWPDTVRLLSRPTLWPPQDRPRRAAVSTFGAGGGNAHVVLEQAPEVPPDDDAPVPLPFRVTGRTPRALREHARALLAHLDTHHLLPLRATAATLATGRTRFEHRAVVVARDHAGLRAGLAEVAAGATGVIGDPVDEPDWAGVRRVELPTHPFQRERYWLYDHARAALRTALSP